MIDYTNWQNEWPAKGLLKECRRLWSKLAEQEILIAMLEDEIEMLKKERHSNG